MGKQRRLIGEILKAQGLIDDRQLQEGLNLQREKGVKLGVALQTLGYITGRDLVRALAIQFNMPYVELKKIKIPRPVIELLPENVVREHHIVPLEKTSTALTVAMSDPLDLFTLDNLRFILNAEVEGVLAAPEDVAEAITKYYGVQEEVIDRELKRMEEEGALAVREGGEGTDEDLGDEAPVVKLVTMIIREALRARASDIHVEPMEKQLRIRFRIDGVAFEVQSPPKKLQSAILQRIKIMAKMDIAEKRRPQDGRIKLRLDGQDLDLRVSALPAIWGESVVLRILRKESLTMGIQGLGFHENDYRVFQSIIKRPNGIFLVTGPTGSGKSTTLYAALSELNRPDRKIITVENPVEYLLEGVNQVEVNEKKGLTFPRVLRAMLRQAPEIILVGEIRDRETADIAIQAALTGHLVFSTLHTNDAPSAITRLIDMGVKPFLVASGVLAVMAQRLVRTICADCGAPDQPEAALARGLGLSDQEQARGAFKRGKGCPRCQNTGYHGRIGIFEVMEMNTPLREMAFRLRPTSELRRQALQSGMHSLRADGVRKALQGVTTLEEVVQNTKAD